MLRSEGESPMDSDPMALAMASVSAAVGASGEVKSFSCTICQTTFDRISALNKHMRVHSDQFQA